MKSGIGYLMKTTVDCTYGIKISVDGYPANKTEHLFGFTALRATNSK